MTISPDGKTAAAACRSEVALFDVDAAPDAAPRRLPTDFDQITHVELSPDGQRLAASGGSPQQFGGIIFFDAADGKRLSSRRLGTDDTFFKGNFAPDGQTIALGGSNGAVYLIPVEEKGKVKTIELHSDWVTAVAYTADGRELVSGSRDKTTKISSVEGRNLLRSVDQSAEFINAVAADSLTAYSGGNARALLGYDFKLALSSVQVTGSGNGAQPVSNRDQFANLRGATRCGDGPRHQRRTGSCSPWSPRAPPKSRASTLTENRQRKITIPNVPAPVFSVALNHDGSRLILGSKTGLVQVWDTNSGKLIKVT